MSNITSTSLLDLLYGLKLPQVYREYDVETNYSLKRYLSALIDGGYIHATTDITSILNFIDPEKCPKEFLPIFSESFGFEYYEDIGEVYQRRFLQNIGEILRRRGTYSCIRYLVQVITGLSSEMYYDPTTNTLDIQLLASTLEQILNIDTSITVIETYLQRQLPYFINPEVNYRIVTQELITKVFRANVVSTAKHYKLQPN